MRRGGPLRRTPLAPMSAKRLAKLGGWAVSTFAPKRVQPAVPPAKRLTLAERSGGWCEAQLEDCWGRAVDPHHRVTRKDGGRHRWARERSDRLSSLLHLCRCCHAQVHADGARSYAQGWLVLERENSAQVPVLYRGQVVYLDDFGGVHSYERAGA